MTQIPSRVTRLNGRAPAQSLARVVSLHSEVLKARLVVGHEAGQDVMTLHCVVEGGGGEALAAAIAKSLQSECKVRGTVVFAGPDGLPNDGKVIEDVRTYE